jgi:hypothetical protein
MAGEDSNHSCKYMEVRFIHSSGDYFLENSCIQYGSPLRSSVCACVQYYKIASNVQYIRRIQPTCTNVKLNGFKQPRWPQQPIGNPLAS